MPQKCRLFFLPLLLFLPACAAFITGTTQTITVFTDPPDADCVLVRKEGELGHINPTPGSIEIDRTKNDLTITCTKPGYQPVRYYNHSGMAGSGTSNTMMKSPMDPTALKNFDMAIPEYPVSSGNLGAVAVSGPLTVGTSFALDSAWGADNEYDSPVLLTLPPAPPPELTVPASLPKPPPIAKPAKAHRAKHHRTPLCAKHHHKKSCRKHRVKAVH